MTDPSDPLITGEWPTAVQTPEGPRSTCCNAPIGVTRVVSDLIRYTPDEVIEDGEVTLVVNGASWVTSLDSEAFEVRCTACNSDIDVEVEEGF